eukprot:snap_masked-scaffold_34-processed-gene-3.47-mRNA-1 protein AED:1.00 eAED:1.00 QI:0/-1/0/0/-1/1/1/0/356
MKQEQTVWNIQQKIAVAIFAAQIIIGVHYKRIISSRRNRINSKDRVKRVPPSFSYIQDHPVIAYLLENSSPWILSILAGTLRQRLGEPKGKLSCFLRGLGENILLEEGAMMYNHLLVTKIYSHSPYFSRNKKVQPIGKVCKNYFTTNFPMMVVHAFIETMFLKRLRDWTRKAYYKKHNFTPVIYSQLLKVSLGHTIRYPLLFLFKLCFLRFTSDLMFWFFHYIMHKKEFYSIHKKHHEHNVCRLKTNYHFSFLDFLLEAQVPFILSTAFLNKLNPLLFFTEQFEHNVLMVYFFNLEILSHAGKAVPLMGTIAPLTLFFKYWDDWNNYYHETHHNLIRCNYSITPFWDWVFGTDRYP